ncbi:hypothetical protein GCM10027290_01710 [Micromonospora sonneratiae]
MSTSLSPRAGNRLRNRGSTGCKQGQPGTGNLNNGRNNGADQAEQCSLRCHKLNCNAGADDQQHSGNAEVRPRSTLDWMAW